MPERREELIIPLMGGRTLRCGEGDDYDWGAYVRLVDAEGNETHYWDKAEWQEDPECVMGAIFGAAVIPPEEVVPRSD